MGFFSKYINMVVVANLEAQLSLILKDYEWTGDKNDRQSAIKYVTSKIFETYTDAENKSETNKVFDLYRNAGEFRGVNLNGLVASVVDEYMGSRLYKQFKYNQKTEPGAQIAPADKHKIGWFKNRLKLLGINKDSPEDEIVEMGFDTVLRAMLRKYEWSGDINDRSSAIEYLSSQIFDTGRIFDIYESGFQIDISGTIDSLVDEYMESVLYRQFAGQKKQEIEAQEKETQDKITSDEEAIKGLDILYKKK